VIEDFHVLLRAVSMPLAALRGTVFYFLTLRRTAGGEWLQFIENLPKQFE
jgi:hypothetical protein